MLTGRLPHPPLRIAVTPSAGVTAPGTLRASDQCKRHRRDNPGGESHRPNGVIVQLVDPVDWVDWNASSDH
ncbi:hypothetical protein GCM10012285_36450 [Streptomyces kronopolitis]|uniref:Uncharacterized protein n=1 Tax=Streptomyces kronopolitis TaxID=1612435 RepID=A0ABQ2JLE7_9ACTN|nr:hypothetical protein GCM10012285_36450 [Streptomyces kronopolitis]